MALPRLLLRTARPSAIAIAPASSLSRLEHCSRTARLPTPRSYAAMKLDVQRLRVDVDKRARNGFYTLMKQQGPLSLQPSTADAIINDFIHHTDNKEYGPLVQSLAKKYNLTIEDFTSLALVTYKIPDLSDPSKRALLPQSQHKPLASQLFQGCAQLADPLAIIHIMTAVYLSALPTASGAREIASLFPRSQLAVYRETLDSLASKNNSDALVLQGLFAQRNGNLQEAKSLFDKALKHYKPETRHPMQLPLLAPWNAIGILGENSTDPDLRSAAQTALATGVRVHDDPLSCAHLASFYNRDDTLWLKYTSKAAASGHRDASANLALFYRDAAAPDSPLLAKKPMQDALHWLFSWKKGSHQRLAEEWAHVAADMGHKPSMLLLADWYEARGEQNEARTMLQMVMDGDARAEEWPQIVDTARKRLMRLKTLL